MAEYIDRDAEIKRLENLYCVNCTKRGKYPMYGAYCKTCWALDAPAVNCWISVEDALPDALQSVLVCTDINTVTIAWINGDGWTFADTGNGHTENWSFEDVKYWMHLPEPPEEGADNG